MKIDSNLSNLVGIEAGRADASRARTAASSTSSAKPADANTSVSSSVGTMAAGLEASPEVRTAKVTALQAAVAGGQYQVVPSVLAQNMMRELM